MNAFVKDCFNKEMIISSRFLGIYIQPFSFLDIKDKEKKRKINNIFIDISLGR